MNDENFDPQQSMMVINSMIDRAQNKLSENGFLFIFWGWLVFIASLTFWILVKQEVEEAWFVWLLMPFGGVFTMVYSFRQKKREKVRSYIDGYVAYVATAFGISLAIVLSLPMKFGLACYPTVIMLYAIMTFIMGGIIRFRPLVICGLLSFPISIASLFFPFIDQVLFVALSVLISYIIPGHWLMAKHKKQSADV